MAAGLSNACKRVVTPSISLVHPTSRSENWMKAVGLSALFAELVLPLERMRLGRDNFFDAKEMSLQEISKSGRGSLLLYGTGKAFAQVNVDGGTLRIVQLITDPNHREQKVGEQFCQGIIACGMQLKAHEFELVVPEHLSSAKGFAAHMDFKKKEDGVWHRYVHYPEIR